MAKRPERGRSRASSPGSQLRPEQPTQGWTGPGGTQIRRAQTGEGGNPDRAGDHRLTSIPVCLYGYSTGSTWLLAALMLAGMISVAAVGLWVADVDAELRYLSGARPDERGLPLPFEREKQLRWTLTAHDQLTTTFQIDRTGGLRTVSGPLRAFSGHMVIRSRGRVPGAFGIQRCATVVAVEVTIRTSDGAILGTDILKDDGWTAGTPGDPRFHLYELQLPDEPLGSVQVLVQRTDDSESCEAILTWYNAGLNT